MDSSSSGGSNKQVVIMAFGLPVMTSVIVIGSMYAGHIMTTRSDRPTNVVVTAATPNIDVKVPQAAPPTVQVSAPPATVDVHVPQGPAPQVTFNAPASPAPNITVNPAAPTVTVIREERERERERERPAPVVSDKQLAASITPPDSAKPSDAKLPATPADVAAAKTETPVAKPAEPTKADPATEIKAVRDSLKTPEKLPTPAPKPTGQSSLQIPEAKPLLVASSGAYAAPSPKREELTLDTLYKCATQYVDSYCRKNGLNPVVEERKWNKSWHASVEQAISDNIDSTEQSYINRMVIAKRDYFNIEKASPEKIVEACRLMLRYRDGQLAWLSAMKEAMTDENLKKTVVFLTAGPK